MFADTDQLGVENTFLQIADDDLLQVDGEGAHEVLHQIMRQGAAGVHFFQGHGNSLSLKSSDDDRQAS
jgi:hypothetical protein